MAYTVAILTVSDTAFDSGESSDLSGPALQNILSSIPSNVFKVVNSAIVPDDVAEIQRVIKLWCNEGINLVLTTGGTGFGVRDVTPEALSPLIDKFAPGLVTLMLTHSLSITPLAALSRPVAGVRLSDGLGSTGTLIISLPGSPKGSKENLESLLRVLPHALDLATGGTGKVVHAALGSARELDGPKDAEVLLATTVDSPNLVEDSNQHHHDHQHHHSHSHGHTAPKSRTLLSQDPSIAAAARQRQSPYPLVPTRDAIALILSNTHVAPLQTLPVTDTLTGCVMGEDVISYKNIPERPTTNVDGYAVRSTDTPGVYTVLTQFPTSQVPAGSIYRINTGAPLPDAFDSVIMVEDTELVAKDANSTGEEMTVKLLAQVEKGENVRNPGSDVKKGDKVLERGDFISSVGGELGTLAFVGKRSVAIHRRPVVAVLSTGNELVDILDTSTPSQSSFSAIPDSNRPSLLSILKHLNFDTIDLGIAGDTMEATAKALKRGKEEADVIISTGGTSMGVADLLKPCIETMMSGTIYFGRVAMKPGKPTTFATIPAHPMAPDRNPKLVFALPGNPAGALVTFFLFVLPALRKMEGRRESEWELPRIPVQITTAIYLDSRPEYHRVHVRPAVTSKGMIIQASSTGGQRSSRTVSLAGSNGLLELPAKVEGEKDKFEEGDSVMCVLIGEMGSLIV